MPLPWIDGVQREMGEVAIEGVGTMELAAEEKGALHRIDASELNATLQTMAREAVLAAFKYQRRTPEAVTVELNVTRFPESAVLAAVADRAMVTTLVTHQGRALTEMTMHVRNQGQPFMKVGLPQGATLLSAEVAGVSVKPVLGSDGARVPLLRPGFRPPGGSANGPSGGGSYQVSFVYLQSGEAYAKKGDARLTLARVDLAISLLEWELFLPEGFQVKRFEGDVLPQQLVASTLQPVMPEGVISGGVDRIIHRCLGDPAPGGGGKQTGDRRDHHGRTRGPSVEHRVGQRAEPAAQDLGRAPGAHRRAARRAVVSVRQARSDRRGHDGTLHVSRAIVELEPSPLPLSLVPGRGVSIW